MTLEHINMLSRLKHRFDNCYDDYIQEILEMDKKQIIESVSEILAIKEVHIEMCFWLELSTNKGDRLNIFMKPMSEQDATYLLSQDNSLKLIASKWWFHTLGIKPDFREFYENEITTKQSILR